MMLIVDEQQLVAFPGIRQAYPAGIAVVAVVGDPALGALCGKFRIGQCE